MPEIHLTWTWELESPLHCGSGLSNPAIADRLVQRDRHGAPAIYGDLVKGALRLSAEQVTAWLLGRPEAYEPNAPAEPTSRVLAALFGGDADAHFSGKVAKAAPEGVMTSTAICHKTGAALDDTLRKTEFLGKGTRLSASVRAWVGPEDDERTLRTLLVSAIAATEAIGGKAGIGWGRVRAVGLDAGDVLAEPRLRDLATALAQRVVPAHQGRRRVIGTPAAVPAAPTTWFRVDVTLEDPACFPIHPEISNHHATARWLPATTLRGALFADWERRGTKQGEILAHLGDHTIWTPGLPATEDGTVCYPAPQGLIKPRVPEPGDTHAINTLTADQDTVEHEERRRRMIAAEGWIPADATKPALLEQVHALQTRMHVARDYATGSKRSGALYSRESLDTGARFVAWVKTSPDAFGQDLVRPLWLGRRKSTGGEVTATVTPVPAGPNWPEVTDKDLGQSSTILVQLISPTTVRDDNGWPVLELTDAFWTTLAGVNCRVVDSRAARTRRGGWMLQWGHQRVSAPMLEAGSVWQIRCNSAAEASKARAALRAGRYVGERQHEVCGVLVIEPIWLHRPIALPVSAPGPRASGDTADVESGIASALETHGTVHPGAQKPLQQLAVWMRNARTAEDVREVIERCDTFANRDRAHDWAHLKHGAKARSFLDTYWGAAQPDIPAVRFAIDALLIRASTTREGREA